MTSLGSGSGSGDSGGGGKLFTTGGSGGGEAGGAGTGGAAAAPAWELREDHQDERLGMPRDLNGDSILDDLDHASDYILLPVRIRVEWQGRNGPRSFEIHSMLTEFRKVE